MDMWRFRLMVAVAVLIFVFGDFLGINSDKDRRYPMSRSSPTLRDDHPTIYLENTDPTAGDGRKQVTLDSKQQDACLPKMLCEIASKPAQELNDHEGRLLEMIRSTTLSLSGVNTKWHHAAHMGELMRHTFDESGCANLWPTCPYSSKRLTKLRLRLVLK